MLGLGGKFKTIFDGMEMEKKMRKTAEKFPVCCKKDEREGGGGEGGGEKERWRCCGKQRLNGDTESNMKDSSQGEMRENGKEAGMTRTHSVSQIQRDINREIGDH